MDTHPDLPATAGLPYKLVLEHLAKEGKEVKHKGIFVIRKGTDINDCRNSKHRTNHAVP